MSDTTTPSAPTAQNIPPISPDDALFHDVIHNEQATLLKAWLSVEAAVAALPSTPKKLPSVDLDYAASQIIKLWPVFANLRTPTLSRLSTDNAINTAAALDSLPRLAFALIYACHQEATEPGSGAEFSALISEALALRDRGLVWCQTLENMGHIKHDTTSDIKKGRQSHSETISDLQDIFDALDPHRATLTALTSTATTTATLLTPADLDRMPRLSTLLFDIIARPNPAMPWRTSLLRLSTLIEDAYEVATAAIRYHLTLAKNKDRLKSIPPFGRFRRPPQPKPPTP